MWLVVVGVVEAVESQRVLGLVEENSAVGKPFDCGDVF